jgi:hypothetical protein
MVMLISNMLYRASYIRKLQENAFLNNFEGLKSPIINKNGSEQDLFGTKTNILNIRTGKLAFSRIAGLCDVACHSIYNSLLLPVCTHRFNN